MTPSRVAAVDKSIKVDSLWGIIRVGSFILHQNEMPLLSNNPKQAPTVHKTHPECSHIQKGAGEVVTNCDKRGSFSFVNTASSGNSNDAQWVNNSQ